MVRKYMSNIINVIVNMRFISSLLIFIIVMNLISCKDLYNKKFIENEFNKNLRGSYQIKFIIDTINTDSHEMIMLNLMNSSNLTIQFRDSNKCDIQFLDRFEKNLNWYMIDDSLVMNNRNLKIVDFNGNFDQFIAIPSDDYNGLIKCVQFTKLK